MFCLDRLNLFDKVQESFKHTELKNKLARNKMLIMLKCFPGGSVVKNPPASAGDPGLIPGSGGAPGEGNGKSLQYSCLEKPMDRGIWQTIIHGVAKS